MPTTLRSARFPAHFTGFSPLMPMRAHSYPWHRAWVEHRRLNRLEASALSDIGMSLADRASVTLEIIITRMQRGC